MNHFMYKMGLIETIVVFEFSVLPKTLPRCRRLIETIVVFE